MLAKMHVFAITTQRGSQCRVLCSLWTSEGARWGDVMCANSDTAIITAHTKFALAEDKMSGRERDSVEGLRRGLIRAGGRAWDENRGEKV